MPILVDVFVGGREGPALRGHIGISSRQPNVLRFLVAPGGCVVRMTDGTRRRRVPQASIDSATFAQALYALEEAKCVSSSRLSQAHFRSKSPRKCLLRAHVDYPALGFSLFHVAPRGIKGWQLVHIWYNLGRTK